MSNKIINHNHRQRRDESPNYHVFMLRYWVEPEDTTNSYRLTAEDIRTGQRQGFTRWEDLVSHLQKQIVPSPELVQ